MSKGINKAAASKERPVFKLIAVIIPVIILLLPEGLLRITGYGDDLSLFIQNPTEGYDRYMMVNPEVGKKYFQKFEYTAPANDIFLKDKPVNTFRIFVMGSSVVFGFPYDRNLMFSRILHQQLEDAYPDKKIEMVNTSITAINSFTLLDFIDEILEYQPDAILMYEGHNEFYGAFGIGSNETMSRYRGLTRLHITLMDSRLYQLMRNIINSTTRRIAGNNKESVHGTLMKRMAERKAILLNSKEYKVAMDRYRQNMGDLLEKAHKKNVPVFLSDLVSNICGMEPFCSNADDTLEAAVTVYEKAKLAVVNQHHETALQLYYRAKDLDCIRFRASEDINRIINELCEEYDVIKVPMLSWFQDHSPQKLIGNNYMTEHVHPNIDGIFLMAEAFFNEITQSGILGKKNEYHTYTGEYYKRNWGYSAFDTLLAYHRIRLLKGFWPFVKEDQGDYDYRINYQPENFPDSLAFEVNRSPGLLAADMRLELARQYEERGQIYAAYREYEALIRTNPYIAINYRDAARCLLALEDLPRALKYFHKSLEYEDSYFACYRIAEICMIMGDYEGAIKYFEKSFYLAPEENKINILARSYMASVYARKTERAEILAIELERVNAFKYLKIPPKAYTFNDYIPYQTREQVTQAKQLIQQGRYEEALALLESSLQVYDSPVVNRMIGEIHFSEQDFEKAAYYFTKVYGQFRFDPQFLHIFTLINLEKKDIPNARRCLQEIRLIDPGYKFLNELALLLL
jgi:tetratricopeptide (TPR) repeat protein